MFGWPFTHCKVNRITFTLVANPCSRTTTSVQSHELASLTKGKQAKVNRVSMTMAGHSRHNVGQIFRNTMI